MSAPKPRPASSHARARTRARGEKHRAREPRYGWVSMAAELFRRGARSERPLDAEVAAVLRPWRAAGDDARDDIARALDTAYDMLRHRRALEALLAGLPFDPTPEAAVVVHLLQRGHEVPHPLAAGERAAVVDALAKQHGRWAKLPFGERVALMGPAPAWMAEALAARHGEGDAEALCQALGEAAPTTVRVNHLKTNRASLLRAWTGQGLAVAATRLSPEGIRFAARIPLTQLPEFREGLFERQDEGSQLLSHLCGVRPGMRVVDACAGAGGKTLHLAALMENRGVLVALDVHAPRLQALKERARRAGVHVLRIRPIATEAPALHDLQGMADAVLVDAPCSGTGTLRRAPDIGWKLHHDDVGRMVREQRHVLSTYARLVKPGGRLVYATCSLLDEENADIVREFLTMHPAFRLGHAGDALRASGISPTHAATDDPFLRLRPDRHDSDGFFGAVLLHDGDRAGHMASRAEPRP